VQQLRAFEPKAAEFAKAGLPIVTVSTDTMDGVAETIKLGKESGGFPFPILSDAHTMAFRAFNAYDDFESKPLHGTYLIDAQGMIRWQHISYEPFMLPDFLLEEAQRLLKLKGTASPVAKVNP
jgi:alkyl hydroperoxide reductase subunit AhpC